jgi:hypothetical protein
MNQIPCNCDKVTAGGTPTPHYHNVGMTTMSFSNKHTQVTAAATPHPNTKLEAVKNAPEEGDEQTETELDTIIDKYVTVLIESYVETGELTAATEAWKEAKAALEAWSRQQTSQVLDLLLRNDANTYTTVLQGYEAKIDAVPVAAIAALRVGLEGKQDERT